MTAGALRWAVLGTGEIARRVVPELDRAEGSQVVLVASRDLSRAAEFCATVGAGMPVEGYAAALDPARVDAVYLPLPNALHRAWAARALDAGLHVLCEKPLATSAADVCAMADASRAAGRLLVEAFMYRHHPQWAWVRAELARGVLGELRAVDAVFTFALDDPSSVVVSPDLGGGALLDVGCYGVDAACWLFGRPPLRALAVDARERVDLMTAAVLDFGGAVAHVHCAIAEFERHRVEVVGTRGSIVLHDPWTAGMAAVVERRTAGGTERVEVAGCDPYAAQVAAFVASVRGDAPPEPALASSLATARALDAVARSARSGSCARVEVA